jgi:hypothetical protein
VPLLASAEIVSTVHRWAARLLSVDATGQRSGRDVSLP